MNYTYPITPYIQSAMAQAMQAMLTGGPLPANCFIVAIPIQQAQQMFPQLMINYASNSGGLMMFAQQPSYYGQPYAPSSAPLSTGPYPDNKPTNAVIPYTNYYPQRYNQNYNYPASSYPESDDKSKKRNRHGKGKTSEPHSNVYNSSSFDSYMRNLSWSRIFERHHTTEQSKDQAALSYDQKSTSSKKQRSHSEESSTLSSLTSSSTSSTTSDETIRRVDVSSKPPSGTTSSTKQQQTKSSLPFKYSSEFVPGTESKEHTQKSKKEAKVKIDDVFVVKKAPPTPPSSTIQQ